jgi:16S rRNA (uracil1498-N3)-methyltransferase
VLTFLTDPARFAEKELSVEGDAYHHLFRVRRTAVGERLRVVDGQGHARWAEVMRVDRKTASLSLLEEAPANEPEFALHLLIPTLRPERAAWLTEKATEVGVFAFHFFQSERAPRAAREEAVERLARVAASAVEQCHRSRLPEIAGPHPLAALLERVDAENRWVLDPQAGPARLPAPTLGTGALLVGPEGGFSETEREAIAAAGFSPVGLGPRILRIETAAVVGAAAVLLS